MTVPPSVHLHVENGYWVARLIRTAEGRVLMWLYRKCNGRNLVHLKYSGREAWNKFREWRWRINA